MSKILLPLSLAALLAASAAQAQISRFEGWSVGANLNMVSGTSTEIPGYPNMYPWEGLGRTTGNISVQASYSKALRDDVLLSIGVGHSFPSATIFKDHSPITNQSIKLENLTSVHVESGLLVSPSTLAFGKASFEAARIGYNAPAAGLAESHRVIGSGFGFGIRTAISANLMLQTEIRRIALHAYQLDAAPLEGFKTSLAIGSVGLAYKF